MEIIKTKGEERVSFESEDLAAADAGMARNPFLKVVKAGRLINGWKYQIVEFPKKETEEEVVPKDFFLTNMERLLKRESVPKN